MSGIGGILYFHTRGCEPGVLETLDRGLAYLGPDGGRIVRHGSAGFVHRAFHATRESRLERQPAESDGIVACLDGRLDNRTDLASALGTRHAGVTDIDLVLASYQRWGHECFGHLIGDFSIVIWDPHQQTLLLGRDPFGICRLFYHLDRDRIVWASTPEALLDCPGVDDEINDDYIGGFLTLWPESSQSPFRSIAPVIPGHTVIVRRGAARVSAFWNLRALPAAEFTPDGKSAAEHAEQLRSLLSDAVRVRLRADTQVTAELSGGLDSSSVVCLADSLSRASGGAIPMIDTLSHVHDEGREGDDGYYIRAVEEQRGRPGIHIDEQDDPILGAWPDPDFLAFPRSAFCYGGVVNRSRALHRTGSRVVLSGYLGDEFLAQHPGPRDAARLLRQGHVRRALALCRAHSLASQWPLITLFTEYGVRPNVPFLMRRVPRKTPNWIEHDFANRIDLQARYQARMAVSASPTLATSLFRSPDLHVALDRIATEGTYLPTRFNCAEMRYPFSHRPLVEFLMSLPAEELAGFAGTRALHKAALVGVLPERVQSRPTKAGPSEAMSRAVTRESERMQVLVRESLACERGYVHAGRVLAEFTGWRHGMIFGVSDLFTFIGLEMWLRALKRRSTRAHAEPIASIA
jgi:asparagine synthase (glutamine-hydrolysing)